MVFKKNKIWCFDMIAKIFNINPLGVIPHIRNKLTP